MLGFLIGAVLGVGGGLLGGWRLCRCWFIYWDDMALRRLPADLRAEVEAYRTAERMVHLTGEAISRFHRSIR